MSDTKKRTHFLTLSTLVQIAGGAYILFLWAIWIGVGDTSGFSGLFAYPMYLLSFLALLVAAIGFIVLAVRQRQKSRRYRVRLLLGALIALLPMIFSFSYIAVSASLENAAQRRATTPISLEKARELITTCQVETIQRYNGGKIELHAYTPALPNKYPTREQRTFDVKYYDELLALARSSDPQNRCGFVPSYDIERAKKPPTTKWITEEEAAAIIGACGRTTQLNTNSNYFPELQLPETGSTGILLSERLSVWNDEKDLSVYIIHADLSTYKSLNAKSKACVHIR